MRNNKGFSLIELIVTIAILAVVSTMVVGGVGLLSGSKAKKSIQELNSGLNITRSVCLSKGDGEMEISCDSSGNYYLEISGHAKKKIADSSVEIAYTTGTDDYEIETTINKSKSLLISFKAGSGILEYIEGSTEYCRKIIVTQNSTVKTIIIIPETGKHYIQ